MRFNLYEGIRFYEGIPDGLNTASLKRISVQLDSFLKSTQESSLDHVKAEIAKECRKRNCNTFVGFSYGQRSLGFLASIFSRDNVVWFGEGYAADIDTEKDD